MGVEDYSNGNIIHAAHWLAMSRAIDGNGIDSGMDVSQNPGGADNQIYYTAGIFWANYIIVTSGSPHLIAVNANTSSDPRWTIFSADSTGAAFLHDGTPAPQPLAPDLPAGQTMFAMILVPGNTSIILDSMIYNVGFRTSRLLGHIANVNAHHNENHVIDPTTGPHSGLLKVVALDPESASNGSVIWTNKTSGVIEWVGELAEDSVLFHQTAGHDHTGAYDKGTKLSKNSMNNRTRRISLDAVSMNAIITDTTAPLKAFTLTGGGQTYYGREFLGSVDSDYQHITIMQPSDFVSNGDIKIITGYSGGSGGGTAIRVDCKVQRLSGAAFAEQTISKTIALSGNPQTMTIASAGDYTFTAGNVGLRISIRRNGTHGSDTYTGPINIIVGYIEYTADM